jgi:hypothetical protein
LPLPLAPPVIVSQAADDDDVQAQPVNDVTDTEPVVADAPTDAPAGDRVYVQGMPACVTVNVRPATVMSALRAVMLAFGVTL